MLKTLQIWWAFFKIAMTRQMEFRTQFLGRISIELVWISVQFLYFSAIFRMNPTFNQWTFDEVILFVGNLFFVDAIYMLLIHENMHKFSNVIRNGLFDSYLLRPVNSVLLGCFKDIAPLAFFNISAAFAVYIYLGFFSTLQLDFTQWLLNFLYVFIGTYIVLAFSILITSVSFWATQSRATVWLFFEFYRLGQRPESFYGEYLRRFVLSLFPAAFFVSIPTQIALQKKVGLIWYTAPFFFAIVVTLAAKYVWNKGITRYEGALS